MSTQDAVADAASDPISDSVSRIVAEVADDLDPADVTGDKELVADLGVDSLAMIEVVVMLEEEHGLRIPTDAVRTFRRVGDLEDYVRGATSRSA